MPKTKIPKRRLGYIGEFDRISVKGRAEAHARFILQHAMPLIVEVPNRPFAAERYVEHMTTAFPGIRYVKGFEGPSAGVYSMIFDKYPEGQGTDK